MRKLLLLVAGLVVFFAGPAWADYNHQMVLHGEGAEDTQLENVSFVTSDGTQIPVADHYFGGGFLIQFPGNQPVAGKLTVSRDGEDDHVIDIPGAEAGKILHVNLDDDTSRTTSNLGNPFDDASATTSTVDYYGEVTSSDSDLGGYLLIGRDQDQVVDGPYSPSVHDESAVGDADLPRLMEYQFRRDLPFEIITSLGAKTIKTPSTGTGTVIRFGGENDLVRIPIRMEFSGFDVEASTRLSHIRQNFGSGMGIWRWISDVSIRYSEYSGSDQARGSVAAGTDDVAITYQDFGGMGVTGVFLGDAGLEGRINRDVDTMDIGVELGWDMPHSHGTRLQPSVFLNYGSMETRINHWLMTPSFADIHQMTWTSLDEHYWDLGGGTYLTRQFDARASGGIGLHAFIRRSDTDFSSKQVNTCGPCGPDNNFTSMLRDSEDDVFLGLKGSAYFQYDLTDHISLKLDVHASYLDSISGVFNPTSGDDLFVDNHPAEIVTEESWVRGYRFSVGFRF